MPPQRPMQSVPSASARTPLEPTIIILEAGEAAVQRRSEYYRYCDRYVDCYEDVTEPVMTAEWCTRTISALLTVRVQFPPDSM